MKPTPSSTPTHSHRPTAATEQIRTTSFSVENDPLPGEKNQDYLPLRPRGPERLRPMDFDRPGW